MASNWYKEFMAGAGVEVGRYTPSKSEPGPPMDLANMREIGVLSTDYFIRTVTSSARWLAVTIEEWRAAPTRGRKVLWRGKRATPTFKRISVHAFRAFFTDPANRDDVCRGVHARGRRLRLVRPFCIV